jgi:hypothetical protein
MTEADRLDNETQSVQALLNIGDFIHEFFQPYADAAVAVWNNQSTRISVFGIRWS